METINNPAVFTAFQIIRFQAFDNAISETTGVTNREAVKTKLDNNIVDRILVCKTFYRDKIIGSFFSCIYQGKLRFHVVFNEETDLFNDEIIKLIHRSMKESGMSQGAIWFRTEIGSLVRFIGIHFKLIPENEQFLYHSTEYIMHRDRFNKVFDSSVLDVKSYEEEHIDKYLELLNDSMSFFIPPQDFLAEKEQYMQDFQQFKEINAFEAFWKDGILVGLYWIDGLEVDTMGVSTAFQRHGYGSLILTRAIEVIFQQNPNTDYALLYAVGWNAKAQQFYQKYGMEAKCIHMVPYAEDGHREASEAV